MSTYIFRAISIEIITGYPVDFSKLILKCIWKFKDPRIGNTMLKKNKIEGLTQPDV